MGHASSLSLRVDEDEVPLGLGEDEVVLLAFVAYLRPSSTRPTLRFVPPLTMRLVI